MPGNTILIQFFEQTGYVTNLLDLETHTDELKELMLPCWIASIAPWQVAPHFGMT
jgi:hypothetical protein